MDMSTKKIGNDHKLFRSNENYSQINSRKGHCM